MTHTDPRPLLVVVSAPSGAGKTTLCRRLLVARPDFVYSVSCTTRQPRGAEVDGDDYIFLDSAAFLARVEDGEFLEHAVVHGHRYGTLRATVEASLAAGRSVLMDIDVQGAAQVRAAVAGRPVGDRLKRSFVDIFIAPPSLEALRERLEGRGEDGRDVIDVRLRNARSEMARAAEFRYLIVNGVLDDAWRRFLEIVSAEGGRQNG